DGADVRVTVRFHDAFKFSQYFSCVHQCVFPFLHSDCAGMPRFTMDGDIHAVQACDRTHDPDIQIVGLKVLALLDMELDVISVIFVADRVIDGGNRPVHCCESVLKALTSVDQICKYTTADETDLFSAECDDSDRFS